MSKNNIESVVSKATLGDKAALEEVILSVKDMIYNLSLRMLLYPEDAKDATQEILIKIVTSLSTFRGDSTFKTWVYRISSNYLLTAVGKKGSSFIDNFDDYGELLEAGRSDMISYTQNLGEQRLLEEEVKVSCTHGLLLCLNQQSRLVYILGDILEFNGVEGSEMLAITPENFRKILSRSRMQIRNFLQAKCGLMDPKNPCRCKKKIDFLIEGEVIDPKEYRFAQHSDRSIDLVDKIDALDKATAIYRSTPQFSTPEVVVQQIRKTLNTI